MQTNYMKMSNSYVTIGKILLAKGIILMPGSTRMESISKALNTLDDKDNNGGNIPSPYAPTPSPIHSLAITCAC